MTALSVLVAVVAIGAAVYAVKHIHPFAFPVWLTPLLEAPTRRLFFNRERAVERTGLAPGMRVLEIGPGGGYVTEPAAARLGSTGQLVCLDVQIGMLHKVRERLPTAPPALVCASGSALPFGAGVFDLVFMVAVFGEIPDKRGAVREYARVLRPRGILAVTEHLPDPDYTRSSTLCRVIAPLGFTPERCLGGWVHYTYRFTRT